MSDLPPIPPRRPDAHQGDFGRVLVVGGSEGLVGAAAMAAEAALRAGAGLVTIACPRSVYPILAAKVTCPMTWPLPETRGGCLSEKALEPILARVAAEMDAVALGPGLGRTEETQRLARGLVERLEKPFVADADALFAIAVDEAAVLARVRAPAAVLTPHPGEMAWLLGGGAYAKYVNARREEVARSFAARFERVVLVLKGHGTLVAEGRDPGRLWRNETGNPGMATGGSGDVLTGVVAALLGQGFAAYDAARLGAHLHGLAGDLARAEKGEVGLIATDLLEALPAAFQRYQGVR